MQRRLSAILVADVVGYSRLMGLDEAGTLEQLQHVRRTRIEPLLAAHGGRIINLMGDGAIVEFASVVEAVRCAVLVQRAMAQRNASQDEAHRLNLRIAVHLGDVMADGDDVYGDGVNVAARLEALAAPGGVVVSETVREHVANKLDVTFEDLGPQILKNIERPVRVHGVVQMPAYDPAEPSALAAASAEPPKPSIAVLPFLNMSGDVEQEYFSDGISEDLITDLSKVSGLFVLARNSTFAYKGKSVDVRELGRKLSVRYVLEGSVRKAGARVRITAQLIDGANGGHVWAERFDRELTDIFAVQDEIAQNIVGALKVRLLPAERRALAGQPTADVEAYQHYLRGRQFFHRHDKRSYGIARRLFERACEIDPMFARARAAIADCDAFLYLHSVSDVSPSAIMATSARALELQPDLPEAHASRGLALYVDGRFAEAEHEFKTALRLDPNLFETWYFYGRAKFVEGKMAEAAELFERAAEIQPDDFQTKAMLENIYRSLDRPADSHAAAAEALRRARQELERHPDNARAAYLGGIMLAVLGDTGRAREWLSRALAIEPDDFFSLYNVACGYAQLGDFDGAIELLERGMPSANEERKAWLRHDSDLDPLRKHPRFVALIRMLGADD
jgi:adenylate cyclase